jgi:hypothetical protein
VAKHHRAFLIAGSNHFLRGPGHPNYKKEYFMVGKDIEAHILVFENLCAEKAVAGKPFSTGCKE